MNRHALTWVAIFAVTALSGCGEKKVQGPAGPPPPAVIVTTVMKKDVPVVFETVAQTEAALTVEIRARVPGFLVETEKPFKEGGYVTKGDVLFQIEPEAYKAKVDEADATLQKAKDTLARATADVKRLEPLVASKSIAQQNLDDAKTSELVARADVLAAEAVLAKAKLDLGYTTMRAPFDGMIGERMVDVGNYVGSSADPTLLATVSTMEPMRAVFHVAESNFLRYQKRFMGDEAEAAREKHSEEMPIQLILSDGTLYEQAGKFEFADRTLDAKAGTLKIVASFPNPEKLLRPGQFARVRAVPEQKPDSILVPQRSVVTVQSLQFVLVVGEGNKVEQRPVKTTDRYEEYFIVSEGLKEGERVIFEGVQKARPGMVVHPIDQASPPAAGQTAPPPGEAKAAAPEPK